MILAKYVDPVYRSAPFEYFYFPRNTDEASQCGRWMDLIYAAKKSGRPAYELEVLAGLHGLAACIYRHAASIAPAVDQKTWTADREKVMLEYIYTNFRDRITLKDIAGSAYLSTHRCCEIFREKIGRPPVEYLNYYRLQVAARLLISSPERTVQRIGSDCGFESPAYFTSRFRKQFGITPKEYRQRFAAQKEH
jgi:AraC-like DNA-binding protein